MLTNSDNNIAFPFKKSSKNEGWLASRQEPGKRRNYLYLKRAFDVAFSLILVIFFLSWMFPFIALIIKLETRGPIFFLQKRVGKNGRIFTCYKFRSMIVNFEADEKQAEENDYRITRVGKLLRDSNLDELPQVFNVLLGHMSIVGPRPHMLSDCNRFSSMIICYEFRNIVRPGITGLAQIKGYHGPATDYDSITTRYQWDAFYVNNASFKIDMEIIITTLLLKARTGFRYSPRTLSARV